MKRNIDAELLARGLRLSLEDFSRVGDVLIRPLYAAPAATSPWVSPFRLRPHRNLVPVPPPPGRARRGERGHGNGMVQGRREGKITVRTKSSGVDGHLGS